MNHVNNTNEHCKTALQETAPSGKLRNMVETSETRVILCDHTMLNYDTLE